MKKYLMHIHTNFSKCSSLKPEKILEVAKKEGFDGVAITDHDSIKGALQAKKLNKDKNFEVIVGEEVSTDMGHVLVYYIKKEIKPGKVEQVIKEARKQKAICVLAHPYNLVQDQLKKLMFDTKRKSLTKEFEHKIKLFDAIEGFNSRCYLKKENKLAQKLAKKYKKPMTAGSDAHFKNEICNSWVEFDDKLTLRQAIKSGKIKFKGKRKNIFINKVRSTIIEKC